MGLEIDRETFTEEERRRFQSQLQRGLVALERLLERPGFGAGPPTIGAELELDLIGEDGRPALVAEAVLAELSPTEFTTEINRFNLEYNAPPLPLAGRPFAKLREQIEVALGLIRGAAGKRGAAPITIGILPTLELGDVAGDMMTPKRRYHALSRGLRELQDGPFMLRIEGRESLEAQFDDIASEGANTSFQVHLRCSPAEFAHTHDAAQLVTAPVLAAAANSPFLLGRALWDETRIALFRQSVEDRPGASLDDWRPARVSFGHGWTRRGLFEHFAEVVAMHAPVLPVSSAEDPLEVLRAGGVPKLAELRLHQGTVWRWNRAIYDSADGGHLRVELRALPSGPTPVDMAANAALALGATLALREDAERWLSGFTFGQARRNFYEAARLGLDAKLLWPRAGALPQLRAAADVVLELCDRAEPCLVRAGVVRDDARAALDVVRARIETKQNGAVWLRTALERLLASGTPRPEAFGRVTRAYAARSDRGDPIGAWDLSSL
jgi:gamma-glutamyl:cysteine ligase YbdK (ATP-grasp superfamily)